MSEPTSLTYLLRRPPALAPEDSVARAIDILRAGGMDTLSVLDPFGRLLGVVTLRDLRFLLGREEAALYEPVTAWMRPPRATGDPMMDTSAVRRALIDSGETTLQIVDVTGHWLGAISAADLLVPLPVRPRPGMVGGMATPWGVYLTNGSLQAGAKNYALVATGACLGLLMVLTHAAVGGLAVLLQRLTGLPLVELYLTPVPDHVVLGNLGGLAIQSVQIPVFLILMRLVPLARYHAAEHQAVHAMERGEPLRPEVVRRMPRVHPRCGTNIMAGGMIFAGVSQIAVLLGPNVVDASSAAVLGALVALFTWRSLGAVLQQHFTTSPAGDKHLASGIAAAEELERKYLAAPPGRARPLRRIWCMGLLQTIVGMVPTSLLSYFLVDVTLHRLH